MPGASLALFADLGVCHVQKSSVTICVLPAPFRWRATSYSSLVMSQLIFLSTPSGWRATFHRDVRKAVEKISIHALRVEGDTIKTFFMPITAISIHALRVEGDRFRSRPFTVFTKFLSTPSGWRATVPIHVLRDHVEISIHALRVEGDQDPRTPETARAISIHALRVEGDLARRPAA